MANKMSLDKAEEIAAAIANAVEKWGRHASVNYTQDQIYEAVQVLWKADSPDLQKQRDDLTKLRSAPNSSMGATNKHVRPSNEAQGDGLGFPTICTDSSEKASNAPHEPRR